MRYFSRKNVKDDFQLSIMNYALWIELGRSGYRRRAFRYIFARYVSASLSKIRPRHFDKLSVLVPVPESRSRYTLAKDAAPIPNALAATNTKSRALNK